VVASKHHVTPFAIALSQRLASVAVAQYVFFSIRSRASISFSRNAASILLKAQAPQPEYDVHDGAPNAFCANDHSAGTRLSRAIIVKAWAFNTAFANAERRVVAGCSRKNAMQSSTARGESVSIACLLFWSERQQFCSEA
jgi:hypothetical protein